MSHPPRWSRPAITALGPDRSPAGLFRRASGRRAPNVGLGQDELLQIVKGAYDIADRQIERGMDAARSLRASSIASGLGEPVDALRRTERLGQESLMLLFEWLSLLATAGPAALNRSWASRLPAAEAALIERWLGLLLRPGTARPAPASSPDASGEAPATPGPTPGQGSRWRFRLQHQSDDPPPLVGWHGVGELPPQSSTVRFSHVEHPQLRLSGTFEPQGPRGPALAIQLPSDLPAGVWRAALCEPDGTQTGHLQIER